MSKKLLKSNVAKTLLFSTLIIIGILIIGSLSGCEKKSENKTENESSEFIFHGFGKDAIVPDFFTEEQQNIYKEALTLYNVSLDPITLDMATFFPLKEGQKYIEPIDGAWGPTVTLKSGETYTKSIGRYRKWADFDKLMMAVFTREAFNELNKYERFVEIDGDLHLLSVTGMPRQGYSPALDTFNLISSSDNEIKFTVTQYYTDENGQVSGEMTTPEIILTKTSDGWRFSKFDVTWK